MPDETVLTDGVEVDDPNAPDDEGDSPDTTITGDPEVELRKVMETIRQAKDAEDEDAEEPPPAKEPEPVKAQETPAEAPPVAEAPKGKVEFSAEQQAHINQIIEDRMKRDRKSAEVRELEAATGKTITQILQEQREARIQEVALENGWDEQRATAHVNSEQRLRDLEAREIETTRLQDELVRKTAYTQAKAEYHNHAEVDPVLKQYAKQFAPDIDAFSKEGMQVDYPVATTYVLGTKLPQIIKAVEAAVEQRVLKSVQTRGAVRPESGGVATPTQSLTPAERQMAKRLGVAEKDWLSNKTQR